MDTIHQKKTNYDINKLPADGYLVLPLSMSRLSKGKGQSPEECFEMVKYFESKVSQVGIDMLFIYTNGLYFNNDEPALSVRKRTNAQMIDHKNALLKLLVKSKKYIPQAAHFIPWDYILLNSPQFREYYLKLIALKDTDEQFQQYLADGLNHREPTEANYHFLIEEIVVTHLIRQKLIDFPKTLVKNDSFRLVIYPGEYLKGDLYQWKQKLLPQFQTKEENVNPYYASQYNFKKKIICHFDELDYSI
ncbi:MAG: hypothetical protein HYV32_04875 [Candidatus Kerfeldbacteria bacterium]|nr:hypothetical protein [Candidatus Kerfeldbacteria bacterium]